MFQDLSSWFALLIGGLIIYGIWSQGAKRWTVRIVVDEKGVQSHTGLPQARVAQVVEFFERTCSLESKCIVQARREPNGYLRTRIKGDLDEGTKQQIRNFLMTML